MSRPAFPCGRKPEHNEQQERRRHRGVNVFSAAFDANVMMFYENSGIAGVYTGFTHKDLYTGQTFSEGEAQWRGFVGGMTVVATVAMVGGPFLAEGKAATQGIKGIKWTSLEPPVTVYRVEGLPNTRIIIGEAGEVTIVGDKMLHLNFGQQARALDFLKMRLADKMPGTNMKTFQVPRAYLEELRGSAVPQNLKSLYPNKPQIVDPTKAPDQFGLRKAQIRDLERVIIPGSGRCTIGS